jgi:hypothetical protein
MEINKKIMEILELNSFKDDLKNIENVLLIKYIIENNIHNKGAEK